MFRGSTRLWSAFGVVAILTAALSNTSCCSTRKVAEQSRTEAAAQVETTVRRCEAHTQTHAATLTTERESRGTTVTEVEIYDTTQPADPATGKPPVKARIRQTHGEESRTRAELEETASGTAEATEDAEQTYEGGTLDEVTVTATKPRGLWERMKEGAAWAAAIMILAAAGWIFYKIKKRKRHEQRNEK